MADPGDMQRLREALAVAMWDFAYAGSLLPEPFPESGEDRDHAMAVSDVVLAVLAEEGWVAPQSEDGASRSVTDRSTPVEEPLATPPFKGQLPGHGLRMEGRVWGFHGWGSGPGKARCYCGEESPSLPTTAARQRWHRQHKAEVAAARQEVMGR